jgi:hypothetical protein
MPGILPRAGQLGVQLLTTPRRVDRFTDFQVTDLVDVSFGIRLA